MSTNFGEPSQGSPDPGEQTGSPATPATPATPGTPGTPGTPAAGSGGDWYRPYNPAGYGPAGYGPGGAGPGGYGPGGYGPGGYGYGVPGGSQDDKRRARRRTILVAGVSVVAGAALTVAGFGAANAFGSTTLTSAQIAAKVDPGLVDIVTNLGYQNGEAAGTGWC